MSNTNENCDNCCETSASYRTRLLKVGCAKPFENEALEQYGDDPRVYRIADASKRIINCACESTLTFIDKLAFEVNTITGTGIDASYQGEYVYGVYTFTQFVFGGDDVVTTIEGWINANGRFFVPQPDGKLWLYTAYNGTRVEDIEIDPVNDSFNHGNIIPATPVSYTFPSGAVVEILRYSGQGSGSATTADKVDQLFGYFFFAVPPEVPPVITGGEYLTTELIAGGFDYNLNIEGDILDNTSFADTSTNEGFRSKTYGIHDVSLSINRHDDLAQYFIDKKLDREKVIIEIRPGGGTEVSRGYYVLETVGKSGDIGALEDEALSFVIDGVQGKAFGMIDEEDPQAADFGFVDRLIDNAPENTAAFHLPSYRGEDGLQSSVIGITLDGLQNTLFGIPTSVVEGVVEFTALGCDEVPENPDLVGNVQDLENIANTTMFDQLNNTTNFNKLFELLYTPNVRGGSTLIDNTTEFAKADAAGNSITLGVAQTTIGLRGPKGMGNWSVFSLASDNTYRRVSYDDTTKQLSYDEGYTADGVTFEPVDYTVAGTQTSGNITFNNSFFGPYEV